MPCLSVGRSRTLWTRLADSRPATCKYTTTVAKLLQVSKRAATMHIHRLLPAVCDVIQRAVDCAGRQQTHRGALTAALVLQVSAESCFRTCSVTCAHTRLRVNGVWLKPSPACRDAV